MEVVTSKLSLDVADIAMAVMANNGTCAGSNCNVNM